MNCADLASGQDAVLGPKDDWISSALAIHPIPTSPVMSDQRLRNSEFVSKVVCPSTSDAGVPSISRQYTEVYLHLALEVFWQAVRFHKSTHAKGRVGVAHLLNLG